MSLYRILVIFEVAVFKDLLRNLLTEVTWSFLRWRRWRGQRLNSSRSLAAVRRVAFPIRNLHLGIAERNVRISRHDVGFFKKYF